MFVLYLVKTSSTDFTAYNRPTVSNISDTAIAPDLWPPNSPDLNPVDYKVCAASEMTYRPTVSGGALNSTQSNPIL